MLSRLRRPNADDSRKWIAQLPLPILQAAFDKRPPGHPWLSKEAFVAECVQGITFRDESKFRERAALLILTEPFVSSECRRWFVEYVILLKLIFSAQEDKLVDLIRYMWQSEVLNAEVRIDCTISVFDRLKLKKRRVMTLCLALEAEKPGEPWIKREIPRYKAFCGNVQGLEITALAELHMSLWYTDGDTWKCRLCGYRSPDTWPIWRKAPADFASDSSAVSTIVKFVTNMLWTGFP
ncbi:hypothetical protein PSACC_00957 [Paramicrosporidium saccamoebae]|uniref:Uncharacterized protein n=1 Tax=Paramicrosporidium saccamoebae TaxID=1246581 RepID=A0A2H9TN71_9FUNG|nr:hypothetical protein PSACC_00957 [Paramicrosporidium saccamoebae]